MGPVKSFQPRSSDPRLTKLPSSAGMGPVKSFPPRFSDPRLTKLPSSAGMGPVKSFPPRLSHVTRPAASVDTPNHSPIGADVFQLVLSVQPGPPVAS